MMAYRIAAAQMCRLGICAGIQKHKYTQGCRKCWRASPFHSMLTRTHRTNASMPCMLALSPPSILFSHRPWVYVFFTDDFTATFTNRPLAGYVVMSYVTEQNFVPAQHVQVKRCPSNAAATSPTTLNKAQSKGKSKGQTRLKS